MSIEHMTIVFQANGLQVQEKALLLALANHTDPSGRTFAGEERLIHATGMPRTTLRRWRAHLVERELIMSHRRGRKGGGRTTSDTYLNLNKLRSMRHPFFGGGDSDKPEDENPFSQVDSNGPASGTYAPENGGNGPASGPINGPASGPTVGPPVGPITLNNPQGEHTHQGDVESVDAVGAGPETGVCVNDDEQTNTGHVAAVVDAAQIAATTDAVVAGVASAARALVTPVRRRQIEAVVGECLTVGHTHDAIVAECRPATNDRTTHPTERVVAALKSLLAVDPATLVTQVTPGAPGAAQGLSGGPECEHGRTGICQACASDALVAAAQARMATAGGAR